MTHHEPSGAQWRVDVGDQSLTVVEVGGGLRGYTLGGVDLIDGYPPGELCPAASGQILAPWPNRLRDGAYRFDGARLQVPISEPATNTAIHGLVHWLRWDLVETSTDTVTVAVELPAQPGYPWALGLRTSWSLGPAGLTATHEVVNRSDRTAPFGLGAHPYLMIPDVPIQQLRLRIPARSRLLTDVRQLPIGAVRVPGTDYDYTEPKLIGAAELDLAFGEVMRDDDGRSRVTLTAPDGRALQVWADERFGWWQVFTGDTLPGDRYRRAVAVEPMTCPPDALRSGRDLILLEPGQAWTGSWGIQPLF